MATEREKASIKKGVIIGLVIGPMLGGLAGLIKWPFSKATVFDGLTVGAFAGMLNGGLAGWVLGGIKKDEKDRLNPERLPEPERNVSKSIEPSLNLEEELTTMPFQGQEAARRQALPVEHVR